MKGKLHFGFEISGGAPKYFTIGPYPADIPNPAAGQSNRETGRIAVDGGARPPLSATFPAPGLVQVGRPDDRTRDTHFAKYPRDLRSIAGSLDGQILKPRSFPSLWLEEHILIDLLTDYGANRTANRAADYGARNGQYQCCHSILLQSENGNDWPRCITWTKNHLSQTGMGVDKTIPGTDQEMPLDRAGPDEHEIAFGHFGLGRKAIEAGISHKFIDRLPGPSTDGIAIGHLAIDTGSRQTLVRQPDTVQATLLIPTMQSKCSPAQRHSFFSHFR
ncbi:MAG: hypothetical protein V7679_03815 [Parasphingorhabdus sp.]